MLLNSRTDLALEAYDICRQSEKNGKEIEGVIVRNETISDVPVHSVEIVNEAASKALGKSIGKYYTIELNSHFKRGSEFFQSAALVLADLIKRCLPASSCSSFLIAALGNPDITPDALGSLAASNILVTRHLKHSSDFELFSSTALCRTGVLGTTGIESAAQIKILCGSIKPDCVIAIDALAGADISRVCSTIQISDSGIAPGSGVGNSREELCFKNLGVPVISIGMPTVIDAAALSSDREFQSMFVTPRGIDSSVRSAARLIAYGINLAVHNGISISDIDYLVG